MLNIQLMIHDEVHMHLLSLILNAFVIILQMKHIFYIFLFSRYLLMINVGGWRRWVRVFDVCYGVMEIQSLKKRGKLSKFAVLLCCAIHYWVMLYWISKIIPKLMFGMSKVFLIQDKWNSFDDCIYLWAYRIRRNKPPCPNKRPSPYFPSYRSDFSEHVSF